MKLFRGSLISDDDLLPRPHGLRRHASRYWHSRVVRSGDFWVWTEAEGCKAESFRESGVLAVARPPSGAESGAVGCLLLAPQRPREVPQGRLQWAATRRLTLTRTRHSPTPSCSSPRATLGRSSRHCSARMIRASRTCAGCFKTMRGAAQCRVRSRPWLSDRPTTGDQPLLRADAAHESLANGGRRRRQGVLPPRAKVSAGHNALCRTISSLSRSHTPAPPPGGTTATIGSCGRPTLHTGATRAWGL